MRMTELVIGEHYAWRNHQRVKLVATGVVLKHYQHRGAQIEIPGKGDAVRVEAVPARELVSTWDEFVLTRAEWNKQQEERRDAERKSTNAKQRIMYALEKLGLEQGISASAYPEYVILTFRGAEPTNQLADALHELVQLQGK